MLSRTLWAAIVLGLCLPVGARGQQPGERPPEFASVEVAADRKITFRVFAPKATEVRLSAGDIPGIGPGGELKKGENGVWEATVGPVPAGAYRYHFNVDGVTVVDPRNPATSESNQNTWSLATVPGSKISDLRDIPHGAVAQLPYRSRSLGKFRRMHVYTPPGYENGTDRYPVLYLLHGAFDCDASWSTVGKAGQILDNLIEAGKAKPMIVVMPAGHTGAFSFGPGNRFERQMEDFEKDFREDVRPLVEKRYRTINERNARAIAGLSMGGAQTLNVALANLGDYGYVGVFSSGVFGIDRGGANGEGSSAFEAKFKPALEDEKLKAGLKLVWFATGKEDFLLGTSRATVEALKKHGIAAVYKETDGGHTWLNWRDYLAEFAPQLFQDAPGR